jgi:hypothetical protein
MLNFDQNEYKIANRLCSDHLQQGCGEIQIREHDVKQKKKKKKKKKVAYQSQRQQTGKSRAQPDQQATPWKTSPKRKTTIIDMTRKR